MRSTPVRAWGGFCRLPRVGREAAWAGALMLSLIAAATVADAGSQSPDSVALTDLSLEELMQVKISSVYSASRYEQKIRNVPASVTIMTSEDIRDYGYRTLAEVLRSVRGMYINYDRNYTLLGIRGFQPPADSNSRLLLLVDGQRVNENIYESAYVGTDCILDVDMIDRVEVVRGPGSSIYGSNALFGIINIVTRSAGDLRRMESSLETSSFDTYKGRFAFARPSETGAAFLVSGSLEQSQGPRHLFYPEFDATATNGGVALGLDHDRAANAMATVSFAAFTLQGCLSSRTKGIPTASYETLFNNPHARTTDTQAFVNMKYQRSFAGNLEVLARTSYSHYAYHGTYPYASEDSASTVLNRDHTHGEWLEAEGQLTHRIHDRHTLVAGVEYRDNFRQDLLNFDEEPRNVLADVRHSSRNAGVYGQGEFRLGHQLALTSGLRYDHYDQFGGTLNPRGALVYHPGEATDLKFLYGRAFRAPNVWEFGFYDPASKANPSLHPETIKIYEFVVDNRSRKRLHFTASGFYNRMDEHISQEIDPADSLIVSRNVDRVGARGMEFELGGRLVNGWRGVMNYTVQRTEDRETRRELANSPRHIAKLNLRVPVMDDRLATGLEMQYYSSVLTLAGHRAAGFWLTNLTATSRGLFKGLDLSGSLYNLLDQDYGHPGGSQHRQDVIPQDGRTGRIKATIRF